MRNHRKLWDRTIDRINRVRFPYLAEESSRRNLSGLLALLTEPDEQEKESLSEAGRNSISLGREYTDTPTAWQALLFIALMVGPAFFL